MWPRNKLLALVLTLAALTSTIDDIVKHCVQEQLYNPRGPTSDFPRSTFECVYLQGKLDGSERTDP